MCGSCEFESQCKQNDLENILNTTFAFMITIFHFENSFFFKYDRSISSFLFIFVNVKMNLHQTLI